MKVHVQVSEQGALRNGRYAFGSRYTVLSELLQNARRAGASAVHVEYLEVIQRLPVTDDGCGIGDFQKLLSLHESGWDEQLATTEGAFGMNFSKCLYAGRNPGCSMCLATNDDVLDAGVRCASTTNRSFEGCQGRGAITHLMSPAMAAAAAVTGAIAKVCKLKCFHGRVKFDRRPRCSHPLRVSRYRPDHAQAVPARHRQVRPDAGRALRPSLRRRRQHAARLVLNQPEYADASILIGGANFGCGSSREHAGWGLQQFGIRAVIAPSLGEIFYSNATNNGLLLAMLRSEGIAAIMADADDPARNTVHIDLETMTVRSANVEARITLLARHRRMLMEGLDVIGLTLMQRERIEQFAQAHRSRHPWMKNLAAKTKQRLVSGLGTALAALKRPWLPKRAVAGCSHTGSQLTCRRGSATGRQRGRRNTASPAPRPLKHDSRRRSKIGMQCQRRIGQIPL